MKKSIDANALSDYDIIKKCINGDEDFFEILIIRYKNLVYSIVLKMVSDREEANDLAQEVFIKVYKNLDKYSDEFKFSTWITRITTNHIIDYRRKKRCETVPIENADYNAKTYVSPESEYLKKEQKINLERLLEELPEMYKIPVVLYHQKGLTYQEIADVTNQSLSKVKNRIFRGRKLLRNGYLKEYAE